MPNLIPGARFRGKAILEVVRLSNGWILLKTEDRKTAQDFKVRTVYQLTPTIRSFTPKHAHFAIDFYGKLCADRGKATTVFQAVLDVWNRRPVPRTLQNYEGQSTGLPGYDLEYILYALNWILDQEDINFTGRPFEKQKELDRVLSRVGAAVPTGRAGSQLAIALFCNILLGQHPVDALLSAGLDVLPAKRGRGTI